MHPLLRYNQTTSRPALARVCVVDMWPRALAVLALIVQLFVTVPAFASNGTMIEICSEFGSVYIEVDLTDGQGGGDADCADCGDCMLCATSLTAMPHGSATSVEPLLAAACVGLTAAQTKGPVQSCTWPETRGPPAASDMITDRATGAIMANFPLDGGAL